MKGAYFLSLNVRRQDVINPNWVRPTDVRIAWKDIEYAREVFTPEFISKLNRVFEISGMMLFNRINHQNPQIAHTDVALVDNEVIDVNCGLNIVFDDSTDTKGKMQWYSIKHNTEKTVMMTSANTPYVNYRISELNLEEEHCIDDFVTLVRTDVPHSISTGNGIRTCISLRFKNRIEWDDAVDLFNKSFNQ